MKFVDTKMFKINIYIMFIIYCILFNTILILSNHFLLTDEFYFKSFSEQLTYDQIEKLILTSEEWQWTGYLLSPIFIFLKVSLITVCLNIGIYFVENKFNYKYLFKITFLSEFVFLIPFILKILWFALIQRDYTLVDIQLFFPFSALSIFDETTVQQNQSWLVYPLQTLNLFEVAYWLLLAKGVSEVIKKDFTKSFELVMASYGTGLVLWVVTIMFITVTYGV